MVGQCHGDFEVGMGKTPSSKMDQGSNDRQIESHKLSAAGPWRTMSGKSHKVRCQLRCDARPQLGRSMRVVVDACGGTKRCMFCAERAP